MQQDMANAAKKEKSGFRLVIKWSSIVWSLVALIGYMILMQQYGVFALTTDKMLLFAGLGIAFGVLLPTLATLIPKKEKAASSEAMATPMDSQGSQGSQ